MSESVKLNKSNMSELERMSCDEVVKLKKEFESFKEERGDLDVSHFQCK